MTFGADIRKIADRVGESVEDTAAAAFIKLFKAVIEETPADTGRLRGEWQTTKHAPASGQANRRQPDKTSGPATADVENSIDKVGVYYLTNLMPYARTVEYGLYGKGSGATAKTGGTGFSIKAPRGMVRISIKRIKKITREQAK